MLAPFIIVFGTLASYLIGLAIGSRVLLPILNVLPAYPFLVHRIRRGRTGEALLLMMGWALTLAAFSTALAYARPERTAAAVFRGPEYRREMIAWVVSGEGRENHPREFIPEHALHAAVFVTASVATGSLLSMPMGAALMNYMGCYVGGLARLSHRPLLVAELAWQPWAIIRMVSFVILGVVLGGPMIARATGARFRLADHRRSILLAAAGLLLDIGLKTALAPAWARLLRGLL